MSTGNQLAMFANCTIWLPSAHYATSTTAIPSHRDSFLSTMSHCFQDCALNDSRIVGIYCAHTSVLPVRVVSGKPWPPQTNTNIICINIGFQ